MTKYFLFGFIALGILLIICFILIYVLYNKIGDMNKRQLRLSEKLAGKRAEDLLYDIIDNEKEIKTEMQSIKNDMNNIKEKQNKCFDRVKIIRYHTTADNEAKLSYSVGISNENRDGLIITGLQYRQGCNMYYKQIKEGVPDYELSEEEKCAVERSNAADIIGKRGKLHV